MSGTVYVIGGLRRRRRPDHHGVLADARPADRRAGGVDAGRRAWPCPRRARGAAGVAAPDGMLLIGGEGPDGPVTTTCKSLLDAKGVLGEWETEAAARAAAGRRASRAIVGDYVLAVRRPRRGRPGRGGPARHHRPRGAGRASRRTRTRARSSSGTSTTPGTCRRRATIPQAGPPTGRCTWSAAQTTKARRPSCTGRSRRTTGRSPSGSTCRVSDLPVGLTGGSAFVTGPNAIIVGGETADGVVDVQPPREHVARRARSSSSARSARPSRASRSTARSASSSAT